MSTPDQEPVFDAGQIVTELRRCVRSGRTRSLEWRLSQLEAVRKLVCENEDDVYSALTSDLRKPQYETYISELTRVIDACDCAIKNVKKWMAPEKVAITLATYPGSAAILPQPLGVVLVISPWNFPFLLALDPVIGAISAGCAVVLKASEIAPATSAFFARMIPKYLDTNAIRVVEGGVPEVSALLEQKWDKIFYTGNSKVGRIIMGAAAKHLTPVTLELGGKCPLFIDDTVDLEVSARRICIGKWGSNNGQACIAPDYVMVEESIASKLVEMFKKTLLTFYTGDPSTSKDLSRIVNKNHFQRITSLLDDPSTKATIVHGGKRDEKSLYIAPTMLLDPPMDSPIMADEIFGPILPIITVKNADAAVDLILDRPKPLALYLFTKDKRTREKFANETSAGGMVVNDCILHFVVPGLPFGGVGESGMGSYHGKATFDCFSHKKSILYRGMGGDVFARYPPFTSFKQSFVKALLGGQIVTLLLLVLGLKKS